MTVSDYLKAHEHLILVIVIGALLLFGYTKGLSYLASRDQLIANKAQSTLQSQVDENKKIADQAQQTAAQYQQLVQKLIASNKQIAAAQSQRNQATQQQQTVDKTLPPSELAARWLTLLKIVAPVIQPSTSGYTVTSDAAVATVVQLEEVPKLQANLQGEQTIVSNDQKQIDGLNGVVSTLGAQVTGLNTQIDEQKKAFVDQVNLMKAKSRQSKLKWFFVGYVAGFVSREIIKP